MDVRNVMLKGALIFGVLGFAVFLILIVLGMVMSALGFTCNCYTVFSWSLIGIGAVSALIFWRGCCCRDAEGGDCKGIKGYKETIKEK